MAYHVVLADKKDNRFLFRLSKEAWEYIAIQVHAYVEKLEDLEYLTGQAAEWGAFYDDLVAYSLMPWEYAHMVIGPDGHYYGVVKAEE